MRPIAALLLLAACGDGTKNPAMRLPAGPACQVDAVPYALHEDFSNCTSLLLVDDSRVYFVGTGEDGAAALLARDKCGTAPPLVLRQGTMPTDLVLVGDQLWATSAGALLYLPPDGPSVPLIAGLQNPHALAVDDAALVFATDPVCPAGVCSMEQPVIWRVDLADGIPVPLVQATSGFVIDIAVTQSWIYFTADLPTGGRLHRVRRDGTDRADLPSASTWLVADRAADQVFLNDGRDLVRLEAESGIATVIARLYDEAPVDALALDPTHLYVTTSSMALQRAPRYGGPLESVFVGGAITAIAVDQRAVYANDCGQGIFMMARR